MKRLPLLLLFALLLLGCDASAGVDPQSLLGLTAEQVEARLGRPRGMSQYDYALYAEDATEAEKDEFFATTAAETWEYPQLNVVFNANGVVMRVEARE